MIKPEELRIGNKVKSTGLLNGRILTVENVTGRGTLLDQKRVVFFLEEKNVGDFCEDLEPIPLTEELLVKAGFEYVVNDGSFENISLDYWAKDALLLFTNGSEPKEAYLFGYGNGYFGKYFVITGRWIYNLHDLQNVYHAWKGTELTIKL